MWYVYIIPHMKIKSIYIIYIRLYKSMIICLWSDIHISHFVDGCGSVSDFVWCWPQYLNRKPSRILGPIKPLTRPCVNRFICGLQKEMSSLRCLRHARRLMWWAHPLSQGRGFQKDWVDDDMVTRTPKWGAYSRLHWWLHDIALWPTIVLSYLSTDTWNIFESLDSRIVGTFPSSIFTSNRVEVGL